MFGGSPGIVVSASPTAEGGRLVHYRALFHSLSWPKLLTWLDARSFLNSGDPLGSVGAACL